MDGPTAKIPRLSSNLIQGAGDATEVQQNPNEEQSSLVFSGPGALLTEEEMEMFNSPQEDIFDDANEVAQQNGFANQTEIEAMAQIVSEALEHKKNNIERTSKDDGIFDQLFDERDDFLENVFKNLEVAASSIDNRKAEYIMSLAVPTVEKAARCLAVYFEFLSTRCKEKNFVGYSINELLSLNYGERLVKIKEIFAEYIIFFRYYYKIDEKIQKIKGNDTVEPSTIFSYCFGLFVGLKIVGVLSLNETRESVLGLEHALQCRATLRNSKKTVYHFKEKTSAIDLIELYRQISFQNLAQFQHMVFLLLVAEANIRLGSATAIYEKMTKFAGLSLKDIDFRFYDNNHFKVCILIRYEKANKQRDGTRVIVLDSAASYCHISASNLLLAFVTKMNYTTTSAAECYQNKKVEFKNHLLDFPLFGRPFKGSVIPGSPLKYVDSIFKWLSKVTGIPKRFLSVLSLRIGNASSIYENYFLINPNGTEADAIAQLIATGGWKSTRCTHYLTHVFSESLKSFRVYNQSVNDAVKSLVLQHSTSGVFLSEKFVEKYRLNSSQIRHLKQQNEEKLRNDLIELRQTFEAHLTCINLKEKYGIPENRPFHRTAQMSDADFDLYQRKAIERDNKEREIAGKVRFDFTKNIQKLMERRWITAKKEILLEDRFKLVKDNYPAKFDYERFQGQMKDVVVPSPFGTLSHYTNFKDIPPQGVICPACAPSDKNKQRFVEAKSLEKHLDEYHGDRKSVLFYCHADSCKAKNPTGELQFREHISSVHSEKCKCECGDLLDYSERRKHKQLFPTHTFQMSWEFDAIQFPELFDRCECSNSIALSNRIRCIVEEKHVKEQLSVENLRIYDMIFGNGAGDSNSLKLTAQTLMQNYCGEGKEIPQCLQNFINSIV